MPCTVKKTYQGHINKNYSVGGCFGLLRSMRKVLVSSLANSGGNGNGDDENENENDNEFAEEQWEEADSVAFVASASEDGDIVLWDVKSKQILQRIESAHKGVCFWVDVHGETGTMVSCGKDARILVFKHRYLSEQAHKQSPGQNGRINGHGGGENNDGDGAGTRYPNTSEDLGATDEDDTMMPGTLTEEEERRGEVADDEATPQTNGHTYHEDPYDRTMGADEEEREDVAGIDGLSNGRDVEMKDD